MDEAEARDTLQRLSAALSQGGADWIVRQVSAAVQEGRTQEKVKVRRPRGRPALHPVEDEELKRRPTGEFTRSLPYSPQEQLALLIEAISITTLSATGCVSGPPRPRSRRSCLST